MGRRGEITTMTKYAIVTDSFEFDSRKYKSIEAAWFDRNDNDAKTVKICDTLKEAREELGSVDVYTHKYPGGLVRADIAFIEAADYDLNEDGEWEFCTGSDIYDFTCEEVLNG
jgi:hypothetical protein